jgi:hypothetical protein
MLQRVARGLLLPVPTPVALHLHLLAAEVHLLPLELTPLIPLLVLLRITVCAIANPE